MLETTAPLGEASARHPARRGGTRLGLWCPQGHGALPLAAALCAEQLPKDFCAWTSEETVPTEPPVGGVDLWLVLCAGDPPPPPLWRWSIGGAWALLPGTATRWTEDTRRATETWKPDIVLSDLLPDETESPVWHDWWREREFIWLPAWAGEVKPSRSRQPLIVASDTTCSGWFSEVLLPVVAGAFGGRAVTVGRNDARGRAGYAAAVAGAERLLLCSNDPIHSGVLLRLAGESGQPCIVWGDLRPGSLRQLLLSGGAATVFTQERSDVSITPVLRALVATFHRLARKARATVRRAHWRQWVGEGAGLFAGDEVGGAARFFCTELRVNGTWDRAAGAAYGAVGGWFRRQVRVLWSMGRSARTEQELCWAGEILGASCDGPDQSGAAVHLLARLRALRCDVAGVELCLVQYAELKGGDPAELPAVAALIFARRGAAGEGAAILRRWPARSPLAFAWFLYGMAWLWVDEEEAAVEAVRTCLRLQPGFWDDDGVRDARWALAAIALQRVGLTVAAKTMEVRAMEIAAETMTLQFLDLLHDTVPGSSTHQTIWAGLLRSPFLP